MFRLIWRVGTFLCLLFALSPFTWTASAAPSLAVNDVMPPHPSLEERIARGEDVTLPQSVTDPSFAQSMAIDYSSQGINAVTGTIKTLAVLVDFSDKAHTVTATYFDNMIFAAPVVGRGSVRDYYSEVSYGQVDIVAVTLPSALGWQLAPHTLAYYVHGEQCLGTSPNCSDLAGDIVDAINSVVDFSQYDNNHDGTMEPILLIHAGRGAEFSGSANDIWSHASSFNARNYDGVTVNKYVTMPEYWVTVSAATSDMTIGVFAHEMGHGFWNLPDLYDRDSAPNASAGIGQWSLMAGGSWNGATSTGGDSPAWPDAWSRIQMGFVSPTNVTSNVTGQSIPQAYGNSSIPTVFKMRTSVMGFQEYFLLENRQRVSGSYDEYLPGDGLFIWHVDEAMNTYALQNDKECKVEPHSSCSGSHYLVALEQADAARHLENNVNSGDAGDLFPGTTGNLSWSMSTHPESSSWYTSADSGIGVANISSSGATMTADLQISGASYPYFLYLPLVLNNYPPQSISLVNGNFESGSGLGWSEFSTHGWPIVRNSGFPGSVTPHGGSWAAWLGGDNNDISYIQQQVAISVATPYLAYYHWIDSTDSCGFDFAVVLINGVVVDTYNLCSSQNTGGWVAHSVNLSAYAGQSVTLQIRVETDSTNNSNLFVDDASFAVTASAASDSEPLTSNPLNSLSKSEALGTR